MQALRWCVYHSDHRPYQMSHTKYGLAAGGGSDTWHNLTDQALIQVIQLQGGTPVGRTHNPVHASSIINMKFDNQKAAIDDDISAFEINEAYVAIETQEPPLQLSESRPLLTQSNYATLSVYTPPRIAIYCISMPRSEQD